MARELIGVCGLHPAFVLALGLVTLSGCAVDDVSVGEEGAGINLDQCSGPGIDCGSSVATTTLPAQEPVVCNAMPSGELRSDFLINLNGQSERMTLGADGSIWILGAPWDGELQHFSADGELIGTGSIRAGVSESDSFEADIAGDARGHAFVVHYVLSFAPDNKDETSERAYVQEYNEFALPVGERLPLARTASSLIAVSNDQLTVAGNAGDWAARGVIGRFGSDFTPLWTQNKVRTCGRATSSGGSGVGVSAIAVDAAGRTTLLTERPSGSSRSVYGIAQFDALGRPLSDQVLSTAFSDGYHASLRNDALGNLTVVGPLEPSPWLIVQSFNADATPKWARTLMGQGEYSVAVEPTTGDVFAAGSDQIFVMTADGAGCRSYSLPARPKNWNWFLSYLAVSATRRIYFMNNNEIGSFSIVNAP